jgi:hypothetical protein
VVVTAAAYPVRARVHGTDVAAPDVEFTETLDDTEVTRLLAITWGEASRCGSSAVGPLA